MPPDPDHFVPLPTSQSFVATNRSFPPPTPYRRAVHAPQRVLKVFISPNPHTNSQLGSNLSIEMGNIMRFELWSRLKHAKAEAIRNFRSRKHETVVDVDPKCTTDVMSERSSAQENMSLVGDGDGSRFHPSASAVSGLTFTPSLDDDGKLTGYPSAKRDAECKSLFHYEVNLAEKKLSALNFMARGQKQKLEEDVLCGPFSPLTDEEEDLVFRALHGSNRWEVLVLHKGSNIEITRDILQCLKRDEWLNDEVINLYLELLKEREQRDPKAFLKCHYFNTFFYNKLISGTDGYDFKAVRRWTTQKKIGYSLIECDQIFVPIHKGMHWCLSVINIKERKFQYLDSRQHGVAQVLKDRGTEILKVLVRYIMDEVRDKSEKDVDVSSWELEYVDDLPAQWNGSDCGMFMIKYIDFYSRGSTLSFSQEDMPYFRKRTAKEILMLKAD